MSKSKINTTSKSASIGKAKLPSAVKKIAASKDTLFPEKLAHANKLLERLGMVSK